MNRIKKLKTVKDFGFFKNYSWPATGQLEDFNDINLFYGFNASGKTSISRLCGVLEAKIPRADNGYKSAEFTLETDGTPSLLKQTSLTSCAPVRVFNKDFVKDHIELETGTADTFYHLIKLDPADKKRLAELESQKDDLDTQNDSAKNKLTGSEDNLSKLLTSTAANIKAALAANSQYLNYQAPALKLRLKTLVAGTEASKQLDTEELGIQTTKATSKTPPDPVLEISKITINDVDKIDSTLDGLLTKEIIAEFIKTFEDDPDINSWAKTGYDLHEEKSSKECLYCGEVIPATRLEKLGKHFSHAYMDFVAEANTCIKTLTDSYSSEATILTGKLFAPELQIKATPAIKAYNKAQQEFTSAVRSAITALTKKRDAPAINQSITKNIQSLKTVLDTSLDDLNNVIKEHNGLVNTHAAELTKAAKTVELHYASLALAQVKKLNKEIDDHKAKKEKIRLLLVPANTDIAELRKKTSGDGPALVEINGTIAALLGRSDLKLTPASSGISFEIQREGNRAETLSEGEQTAIAFAYFCAKLKESGTTLDKTILVIDDPISSLDHHRLYAVASKVKETAPSSCQCFLLTHNYEFFRELKRWLILKNAKLADAGKPKITNFYYIEAKIDSVTKSRYPDIAPMPKLLLNYDSDYHFNFDQLYKFSDSGDATLAYFMPNVARKLLETYLAFKNPNSMGLGGLDKVCSDAALRTEVTRFLDFSNHADYIDRITQLDHTVIGGAKDMAGKILGIIKASDPDHYSALEKMCTS
jgi:wobble nucleotide-excising tRNase